MPDKYLVVLCTAPDQESATSLAETLVDEGLAACVNIVPGIISVYRWQGKRESGTERLLIIKTRGDAYARLEQRITNLHPYELPEIIAVPVETGLHDYLAWIDTTVTGVKT